MSGKDKDKDKKTPADATRKESDPKEPDWTGEIEGQWKGDPDADWADSGEQHASTPPGGLPEDLTGFEDYEEAETPFSDGMGLEAVDQDKPDTAEMATEAETETEDEIPEEEAEALSEQDEQILDLGDDFGDFEDFDDLEEEELAAADEEEADALEPEEDFDEQAESDAIDDLQEPDFVDDLEEEQATAAPYETYEAELDSDLDLDEEERHAAPETGEAEDFAAEYDEDFPDDLDQFDDLDDLEDFEAGDLPEEDDTILDLEAEPDDEELHAADSAFDLDLDDEDEDGEDAFEEDMFDEEYDEENFEDDFDEDMDDLADEEDFDADLDDEDDLDEDYTAYEEDEDEDEDRAAAGGLSGIPLLANMDRKQRANAVFYGGIGLVVLLMGGFALLQFGGEEEPTVPSQVATLPTETRPIQPPAQATQPAPLDDIFSEDAQARARAEEDRLLETQPRLPTRSEEELDLADLLQPTRPQQQPEPAPIGTSQERPAAPITEQVTPFLPSPPAEPVQVTEESTPPPPAEPAAPQVTVTAPAPTMEAPPAPVAAVPPATTSELAALRDEVRALRQQISETPVTVPTAPTPLRRPQIAARPATTTTDPRALPERQLVSLPREDQGTTRAPTITTAREFYSLQGVSNGRAWLRQASTGDLLGVVTGDSLPGMGRVIDIRRGFIGWEIIAERGIIRE